MIAGLNGPRISRWLALALLLPGLAWAQGSIWAEAGVSQDSPRVQESVVYTIRVFSPTNLQSVELTPPSPAGAALEELERGVASTRTVRGRPYVVNEYHYVLTPITAGRLEVGPARVTVRPVSELPGMGPPGWGGQPAAPTTLTTRPVAMTVLPLPAGVPIPLRFLDLKAHWSQDTVGGVGEPLTLTVVTKGLGAVGSRLPSVAPLLRTTDFKIYPDRPQTDWKWGGGGSELWGRRVETFTVVPTREGALTFPALELAWWDVTTDRETRARVAEKVIRVGSGLAGGDDVAAAAPHFMKRLLSERALLHFVLPLAGGLSLAFLIGWWIGTGRAPLLREDRSTAPAPAGEAQGGPAPQSPPVASAAREPRIRWPDLPQPLQRVRDAFRRALAAARRLTRRTAAALAAAVPMRMKAWWCVRCAVREDQPEGLCRVLRRFACRHLSLSPNAPLASIADRVRGPRAGAAAGGLQQVLRDLDRAAYAGRTLDLRAWKREFRRRFRRAVTAATRAGRERPRRGLPELNP
jgi:hypothetical protein